ncbi:fibronectin/fibrinogen-binding protein [Fictibacillus macauensis ZFHKF-1]|uniref:Rqc2 homolog RqcH n=1 Tax=Fictibacillus macauensis ZFHKF-1 TaxID=1196324 RepID=I8UE05_9BACL|nr:NFACT RNA binding domain-containing protein [Fictibacillus macauensis]EIT85028.1 fibronectin/fibrinogen-binding protein [Fictibacillus macauensis ZFHKF-1]
MSFDGIVLKAVTEELQSKLLNGKITKIYQPDQTDLLFAIRAGGKTVKLLLSANSSFGRVQLTEKSYDNPQNPPMFCMLLRKHLEGAIIENIEQIGLERVLHITVKKRDEIGDLAYKTLIIEIMGRHSNIVLIENKTGTIHDCIKHIPPSVNRYRTLLPGQLYKAPPPQDKRNPLLETSEGFTQSMSWNEGKLEQQIVQRYSGLSPLIAKEIVHQAGLTTKEALVQAFMTTMEQISQLHYTFEMTLTGAKDTFYVLPLGHLTGDKKTFATASEMLDRFYYGKAERDKVKQQAADLERLLHNEHDKLVKKQKKLQQALENTEQAEHYKVLGELLTAHLYMAQKGQSSLSVVNYYEEDAPTMEIPLQVHKSPSENAQAYFKKYSKLKNSISYINEQLHIASVEETYFDSLIQQMESASLRDIAGIREELEEQGYLKRKKQNHKQKKPDKPELETYISSEDHLIFVGKNNKQNDYLTFKVGRQNETWLHTKDIPGSHVVIKAEDFGEQTLKEAASLAAFFSKARQSSSVPVDYTRIRHVKKPSGAKPGFVTYDHQQTIYVTPNEDTLPAKK